ncbi:hypothetical protein EST38_g1531 [Candolleomyces aberdarensis]|uniref:AAA+ ATPase domain-containing protein n=1 Tax=Candolleomyces aberdarensis TaxID=2316362 RepID=A0A4Q2DVS9_9AGAR|nr:hypothetical protein EST38_g1531 [Candolleomyces aberdarensis]
MDAIKSLVQPLMGSSSSVVDGMKLVVLGGTVETARRVSSSAWQHFVNCESLCSPERISHFCEEEHTYDWLMLWLSRRPEWQRSREFEATLRAFSQSPSSTNAAAKSPADVEWEEAEREWERYNGSLNGSTRQTMHSSDIYTPPNTDEDPDPVPVDKPRSRIVFQPTYNTTHTLFFRGHYLHIKRSRHPESYSEMLSISVIARSNAILKQLVLQAKKEYEAECVHRIQIYLADAHGSWRWTDSRAKRPLGSIVLNPGVKETLVDDTKDFLRSEKWYMDRGIPFRRGYLLYGVPGSGKSSLIHALAGYLGLDIYVVSLSSSWMSDSTLTSLMGRVPSRCVVLLEDLDAAFTRSTNRDDDDELEELLNSMGEGKKGSSNSNSNNGNSSSNNHSSSSSRRHRHSSKNDSLSSTNTLSLSGLLNALDGISASEGRLLFATTNHLDKLDPALRRPGRMDVWIEFKNASKVQAEGLFRNFFVPDDDSDEDSPLSDSLYSGSEDPEVQARRDKELEEAMKGIDIKVSTTSLSGSSMSSSALPTPTSPSPASEVQGSTSSSSLWSLASSATSLLSGASPLSALSSEAGSPITMPSPLPMTASSFAMPSVMLESSAPQAPASEMDAMAASASIAATGRRRLERKTLVALAKQFGELVPEEEFSVACLQGYLLKHKTNPHLAIDNLPEFIASERKLRETLAAQKASAQAQSQQARERRIAELKAKKLEREEKERRDERDREVERIKEQLKEKEREEELKGLKEKLKEMDNEKAGEKEKEKEKEKEDGAEAKKEEEKEEKGEKEEKKDGGAQKKSDEEEEDKENWYLQYPEKDLSLPFGLGSIFLGYIGIVIPRPFFLPKPLLECSSGDIEGAIVSWMSPIALQTGVEPEKRVLSSDQNQNGEPFHCAQLLPEGRWLLTWAAWGGDGCVRYFDLEEASPVAKLLVPNPSSPSANSPNFLELALDFISDEANAFSDGSHHLRQFNMALLHPSDESTADGRVSVWRVKVKYAKGEGEATCQEFGLEAECISSFYEGAFGFNYLTLYGSTLAYSASGFVTIVDWVQMLNWLSDCPMSTRLPFEANPVPFKVNPVWWNDFKDACTIAFDASQTWFFRDQIRLVIPTEKEIFGLTLSLESKSTTESIRLELLATGCWDFEEGFQHISSHRAVSIHPEDRTFITTHYRWRDDVGFDSESSLFRTDAMKYPEVLEEGEKLLLDPYSNKAMIIDARNLTYFKPIRTKTVLFSEPF